MIYAKCSICHQDIKTDSNSRILRHVLPNSSAECLGSNSQVTDWANELDRLTVEQANPIT